MTPAGKIVFALSFAAIGILSLGSGDFALNWQPVPAWVPWRSLLAYVSGFMLLLTGLGLLFERTAATSAIVLTANLVLWVLLLQIPRVASNPGTEIVWNGLGENLALVAGAWILVISHASSRTDALLGVGQQLRIARAVFGIALLPIGLAHLVYVPQTTQLVPAWLPVRVGIRYVTGAAQIVAGLGLLLGVLPRLAATLEASALATFGLLVWAPRVHRRSNESFLGPPRCSSRSPCRERRGLSLARSRVWRGHASPGQPQGARFWCVAFRSPSSFHVDRGRTSDVDRCISPAIT